MGVFKKFVERVTPPRVNVSLVLKKQFHYPGDDVEGAVQLESREEFDCTEIRCEFQCVERVRRFRKVYDEALKREVEREVWDSAVLYAARPQLSGAFHIPEGFVQSYQFRIPIPPGAPPSFKSVDRVVVWSLKGVVAVKGRPDATSKAIEVLVLPISQVQHTPPTVTCKYCGAVFPQSEARCPNCGAPRTA